MSMQLPAKQTSLKLIERLDDDVTYEDIIYELYFLQKIEQGLEDVRQRRTVSHEEVRKEIEEWLT